MASPLKIQHAQQTVNLYKSPTLTNTPLRNTNLPAPAGTLPDNKAFKRQEPYKLNRHLGSKLLHNRLLGITYNSFNDSKEPMSLPRNERTKTVAGQ